MTGLALSSLILALLGGVMGWGCRRLRIATVDGHSMAPTLMDGDRVLVRRVRPRDLRPGDLALVAMNSPGYEWVIKRIAALPGDLTPAEVRVPPSRVRPRVPAGMLVLLGDNRDFSVDSRDFGYVPAERVFGRVIRRL